MLLDVSRHAGDTGLEGVIRTKPAGEQPHSKLEMGDAPSGHILHGGQLGSIGHEVSVERQQCPLTREFVRISKAPTRARGKVSEVPWQIVLRATTAVAEQQRGRTPSIR